MCRSVEGVVTETCAMTHLIPKYDARKKLNNMLMHHQRYFDTQTPQHQVQTVRHPQCDKDNMRRYFLK